jgi:hypothetical protein
MQGQRRGGTEESGGSQDADGLRMDEDSGA